MVSKKFCSTLERYLRGTGALNISFQSDLAELHYSLVHTNIECKGRKISFEAIEDYKYVRLVNTVISKITYNIKTDNNIRTDKIKRLVTVTDSLSKEILNTSIKRNAEKAVLDDDWFKTFFSQRSHSLTSPQQETLKGLLKESTPIHNLLTDDKDDYIDIEGYQFINNQNQIARALIEVLYQLRNSLFHGEITPTREIQKAYEPAYLILKRIILVVANTPTNKKK